MSCTLIVMGFSLKENVGLLAKSMDVSMNSHSRGRKKVKYKKQKQTEKENSQLTFTY